MTTAKTITTQYRSRCLTCEEWINVGETVQWTPGAGGVWHTDCAEPKNLAVHARAAKARKELGLD